MASRLMLSLKKAAVKSGVVWSLTTMTSSGKGRPPGDSAIRFAPRTLSRPHKASKPFTLQTGDIELELTPSFPQSRDSLQPC